MNFKLKNKEISCKKVIFYLILSEFCLIDLFEDSCGTTVRFQIQYFASLNKYLEIISHFCIYQEVKGCVLLIWYHSPKYLQCENDEADIF